MTRILLAAALAAVPAVVLPSAARAQIEQQQLVDRATLTAQAMVNDVDGKDGQYVLRRARATMICPRVFRAGFLLGGMGGGCVLVARDGAGSWSAPAFYGMGGISVGFQAGLQDAEVMLMIMTDRGLDAVLDSQFKLGADATATFIEWGGGVEGATTAALNADVVGFTRARGLYAGVSISGSILGARTEWNQIYYGRPLAARQIVIGMEASNPAADPLREVLTRHGSRSPVALAPQAPGYGAQGYGYPPGQPMQPQRIAPVQQQPLAPPRH